MGEQNETTEALVMDGRALAEELRNELREEVADFSEQYGRPPGLAMILLGGDRRTLDRADQVATEARNLGLEFMAYLWPEETGDRELQFLIRELNSHLAFDGISIQAPLPPHISHEEMIAVIDPAKDVEGYHPLNVGRLFSNLDTMVPPPAAAGMELLLRYNINPAGMRAVIVGRNKVVGKPMSGLLVIADATVTVCHSGTRNLADHTREADLVITCAGQPNLITGAMLKPGVVVLDYGLTYENGLLVGDVHWESVRHVASILGSSPDGIAPITNLALMANTMRAAERRVLNLKY
ncbi:MAG: bifunctional 5,10-methylenetetrahydrofolate dehydrogenase/5,10-methenyltetrahydrofolate cyclohydrolase [Chloroflexota bacterium]|nr:bifunctional 5,10-methylenetetrahydrofolate dehydrogenase/5,10-methenyltetrahydrofolate cyclohydrolase [Chloroflexota bacterium]